MPHPTIAFLVLSTLAALPGQDPVPATAPTRLEMRPLATAADGLDVAAEHKALNAWLDQDGNRDLVRNQPIAAHLFRLQRDAGKPGRVAWVPHLLTDQKGRWSFSFHQHLPDSGALALFSAEELAAGPTAARPFLVELLPVLQEGAWFGERDLERANAVPEPPGSWSIDYRIVAQRASDYADWTEALSRKRGHAAILLDGRLVMAPRMESRIPGIGRIAGNFTEQEAKDLAAGLDAARRRQLPPDPALDRLVQALAGDPKLAPAHLLVLQGHPDAAARRRAAMDIRIGLDRIPQGGPGLVAALQAETDVAVLRELVTTVAAFGRGVETALPRLRELAASDDRQLAERSRRAVAQIEAAVRAAAGR